MWVRPVVAVTVKSLKKQILSTVRLILEANNEMHFMSLDPSYLELRTITLLPCGSNAQKRNFF